LWSIESLAFADCAGLKSIDLPASLESLGRSCFRDCRLLERVSLQPSSILAKIDANAFFGCLLLRDFPTPRLLEVVGAAAFGRTGIAARFREQLLKEAGIPPEMTGWIWQPEALADGPEECDEFQRLIALAGEWSVYA
jgi:hypothetical protein